MAEDHRFSSSAWLVLGDLSQAVERTPKDAQH